MTDPHWHQGYRCYTYSLDGRSIGYISLAPLHTIPMSYRWSLDVPFTENVHGETRQLKRAKEMVERAYREYLERLGQVAEV